MTPLERALALWLHVGSRTLLWLGYATGSPFLAIAAFGLFAPADGYAYAMLSRSAQSPPCRGIAKVYGVVAACAAASTIVVLLSGLPG